MKKIIAFFLATSIFAGIMGSVQIASANNDVMEGAINASPEPSPQYSVYHGEANDSFSYFIERETLYVYETVNNDDTISIPDRIEDKKITDVWFEEAFEAKNMVLGDGIEGFNVSDNAESSFGELRTITLGKNFNSEGISGINAFEKLNNIYVSKDNKLLKSVEGVLFSKDGKKIIFYPSNRRGTYKVPKGTRIINRCTFLESNLRKIVLPPSVKTIDDKAFSNCTKLKKIVLPSGVKKLGAWSFNYCINLEEIVLPSKLRDISDFSFLGCKKLKKVVITSGVKEIGWSAFSDCVNLRKIEIPSSVNKIDRHAFGDCKRLKEIIIRGEKTKVEHQAIGFKCKRLNNYIINKKTAVTAPKGSLAQSYAKKNGIKFNVLE